VFSTGRAANQTSSGVLDGLKALQVDISNTSQQERSRAIATGALLNATRLR